RYGFGFLNALKSVQAALALAEGAAITEMPADVVALPGRLDMGFLTTSSLELSNLGGGSPVVQAVAANVPWISITSQTTSDDGLGTYGISVNRDELSGGLYDGEIAFTLEDASTVI